LTAACRFPCAVEIYYKLDDILRFSVLPIRFMSNHMAHFAVVYISPNIYNWPVQFQASASGRKCPAPRS